ncbi:hypothetical protein EXN66_Car020897 [Channa argus]|uniref:Uncharacterized protein n=1 Tax=Channa argus TaxID=215402 RepID=A0A6G1QT02_CHAAH|nr:hypothetical protein EXN66_Car020897 [Channa argus]
MGLTVPQITLLSSSIHFPLTCNISTAAHLYFPLEREEEMGGRKVNELSLKVFLLR